jgi:deoxyribonuclease-4
MPLALGASTFSHLYSASLDEALAEITSLGFRWLELLTMPPHIWPGEHDRPAWGALRRKISGYGLEVAAVGPMYFDLNLASTNPAVREVSTREITANIQLAAELGATRVLVIAGRRNPLFPAPLDLTWELGRESLCTCLRAAAEHGVSLCLEPIPYSFISTGAEARRMIDDIGSSWLGGLIDTANSHATEGVESAALALGEKLRHVQLSDTVKGQLRHDELGRGEIDFPAAIAALRATGYDGPFVFELCEPADPAGSLRRSAEALRGMGLTP